MQWSDDQFRSCHNQTVTLIFPFKLLKVIELNPSIKPPSRHAVSGLSKVTASNSSSPLETCRSIFRGPPAFSLAVLTFIVGYAVVQHGGIRPSDWNVCLLLLGLLGLVYRWLTLPGELAPPVAPFLRWPLALLLSYLVFQIVPFPEGLVEAFSPARAYFSASPSSRQFGPLLSTFSVDPGTTFSYLLRVASYAFVFWLTRQLTFRFSRQPWLVAWPIVSIGTLEAIWGIAQVAFRGSHSFAYGSYVAQGPYFVNRNHYAGLLEMALPLAVSLVILQSIRAGQRQSFAVPLSILFVSAALMFWAILHS